MINSDPLHNIMRVDFYVWYFIAIYQQTVIFNFLSYALAARDYGSDSQWVFVYFL